MNLSQAKRIASRRNNKERKKLPLFADQAPIITPEEVLERHEEFRELGRQQAAKLQLFQKAQL